MKWLNLDLPNLTSIINSDWYSFCCPHSVILESILKYWILIWFRYSESSKCRSTWFILESSIKINIEYCLIDLISFIDVSSILADLVKIDHWFHFWIYLIDLFPFHSIQTINSLQSSFHSILAYFLTYPLCSKSLYQHSFVIPLSFNHHLTLFYQHKPNWFS